MRLLLALTTVLVIALTLGCGTQEALRPASSPVTGGNHASSSAPLPRVSYTTACPELIEHGQAGVDLVTEFVDDAQALADRGAATTARFNAVIEDMEYDAKVAPAPLVPYIEVQMETLRGLRDYLQVGGSRSTGFRDYRSAGVEIANQCLAKGY